jgi:beta-galactosidase
VSIWYGGDYNPEQWDAAVWAQDDELMRRAHVNTATVGVFCWALLEPEEGRFEFGWLDATLDRLHANDVRVVLATPTASPPPWFTLAYPDAMPVTRDGTRLWHGSRDTYCAAAPAYRRAALRIAGELARRYASHPALAMWHVHNEYGTRCWCDHAAAAFRSWLRDRYGGLDELNDAWGTAFWSQHYSAWEQILPPRSTQYLPNPAHDLDFRRFWSDELLAAYVEQRDLLRRCSPGVPVTTNFIGPDHLVLDMASWSREVDVVAIDHYLSTTGPGGHADIAFCADWARCAGGGAPWLLMEQAPSVVIADGLMLHREPGRMLPDSLGYVARGADSVLFFQWRASRAGAELYHPALVPHAGPDTRIFTEAAELGAALERIGEVAGSRVAPPDVAVLIDTGSRWALESPVLPSGEIRQLGLARSWHAALYRAGIGCDLVSPAASLSGYRLVIVPAVYLLSDEAAGSLHGFVAGGGHLVATFLSGIADQYHRVRTGGYPGALREVLGIRVEEFHPLPPGTTVTLRSGAGALDSALDGALDGAAASEWSERLRTEGADILASYAGGVLAGLPAITRNTVGHSAAWYISTVLAGDAHDALLRAAVAAAGVRPVRPDAPPGVAVTRRLGTGGRSWLFAFNHTDSALTLPAEGLDLLTGRTVTGALDLPSHAVALLREAGACATRGRGLGLPCRVTQYHRHLHAT